MSGKTKPAKPHKSAPATTGDVKGDARLDRTFSRADKINLIGTIIVIGFAVSWVYCYYFGIYLHQPYPKNTFLFQPNAAFSDFVNSAIHVRERNPYFVRSIAPSNYYPFGNIHSWIFTALLPLRTSHLFYLAAFGTGMVLLCRHYLRTDDKVDFTRNVFVFAFLSYPFLFTVDRSNFEAFLFLYLALFILFFSQKRYLLSSLFLAIPIAMKAYPVVFLLLFASEKRYREMIWCVFAVIFLTFGGLVFQKGGYIANLNFMLSGFSSVNYITNQENIVQRSMSLFTMVKMLLIWSGLINSVRVASLVLPYYAIMAFLGGLISIFVVFIQGDLWKKVALLTFACLLFPHVSADYKLIHLFIPLFLFINADAPSRHDKLFAWLFGLLLIPKGFYYFDSIVSDSSTHDISIAVPVNISVLALMTVWLLAAGLDNLRVKLPLKDFKRYLAEHVASLKPYTVHLAVLGIIGVGLLLYTKVGMKEYKQASRNLALSQTLCDEGKYAEALAMCEQLIAGNHTNADVYYVISSAKIGLKQWQDAARAAELALGLAPDYTAAWQNLNTARAALNPGGAGKNQ
jgi:hypothetical protein